MTPAAPQLLPGVSWTDDTYALRDGKRLARWGTVGKACAMLDDCDRHDVYALLGAKMIKGYKLKPWAENSKWKVDLTSVWEFKQKQLSAERAVEG